MSDLFYAEQQLDRLSLLEHTLEELPTQRSISADERWTLNTSSVPPIRDDSLPIYPPSIEEARSAADSDAIPLDSQLRAIIEKWWTHSDTEIRALAEEDPFTLLRCYANQPPRPPNKWITFRSNFVQTHPGLSQREASKQASVVWNRFSKPEKDTWEIEASETLLAGYEGYRYVPVDGHRAQSLVTAINNARQRLGEASEDEEAIIASAYDKLVNTPKGKQALEGVGRGRNALNVAPLSAARKRKASREPRGQSKPRAMSREAMKKAKVPSQGLLAALEEANEANPGLLADWYLKPESRVRTASPTEQHSEGRTALQDFFDFLEEESAGSTSAVDCGAPSGAMTPDDEVGFHCEDDLF